MERAEGVEIAWIAPEAKQGPQGFPIVGCLPLLPLLGAALHAALTQLRPVMYIKLQIQLQIALLPCVHLRSALVRNIFGHAPDGPLSLPKFLNIGTANILGQLLPGRCVFEQEGRKASEFKTVVVELMTLPGAFNLADFIPQIAWMDVQGIQCKMKFCIIVCNVYYQLSCKNLRKKIPWV